MAEDKAEFTPAVEPGYYRKDGEDYLVIDPFKLSDTGRIEVKDDDDARWKEGVAYRLARDGSNLRIRPARGFKSKFSPTTKEEVFARIREAEAAESKRLADEAAGEAAGEPLELEDKAE